MTTTYLYGQTGANKIFDGTDTLDISTITDGEVLIRNGTDIESTSVGTIVSQTDTTYLWTEAADGSVYVDADTYDLTVPVSGYNTFNIIHEVHAKRTDVGGDEVFSARIEFGVRVTSGSVYTIPQQYRRYITRDSNQWRIQIVIGVGSPFIRLQFRNAGATVGETITVLSKRTIIQEI